MRTLTIKLYRNRTAFEARGHFPDDGNGQEHTKAAAFAWAGAATRVLTTQAGWASSADLRYGNDSSLHGPYVTVTVIKENPGLNEEPEYEDDPTPDEMTRAQSIAEDADLMGWKAAGETVWIG